MKLELKNIRKDFKQKHVLTDINLSLACGSCILIQGINGCGKSTLLKIIAKLMEPSGGMITYPEHVNVGALIENPNFIEDETIRYNLEFLYNIKATFDPKQVSKLCESLHLDLSDKSKMKNYSIGMRQKVGFIQAIMEHQNLILLDEPTRGLDDEGVACFVSIVNQLRLENKTIIICSHDRIENLVFTSRYKMKNGELFANE